MTKKQKALNQAFYATLVMSGLSLISIILFSVEFIPYTALAGLIIFPILGFLVMKGKRLAGLVLIIVFLIDRLFMAKYVIAVIQQKGVTSALFPVFLSLVYWTIFYRAYLYLKRKPTTVLN